MRDSVNLKDSTDKMRVLVVIFIIFAVANAVVKHSTKKNMSDEAVALMEIVNALHPASLVVFSSNTSPNELVDDFIYLIHNLHFKTCIFFDKIKYFKFIEQSIMASISSSSLIFVNPNDIVTEIHERGLAHRLSLFMFYWGANVPPKSESLRFEEPLRAVVITRPRQKAFRIYYNQAVPIGKSNLKLVNWYDAESLGLYKTPLLPSTGTVYSNFEGRIFTVPVIHSPPWFFVSYINDTYKESSNQTLDDDESQQPNFTVHGGRDHHLLKLLGEKMNFHFNYVDPSERTQGTSVGEDTQDFTGGIGMIQNRDADLLLGDVGLSWERRKAVEFSFFILADSGAFVTHAPRKLNEALAILRPFKLNVWPYLVLTIILSGPAFYLIISIPYKWNFRNNKSYGFEVYPEYINEITMVSKKAAVPIRQAQKEEIPNDLFEKCIWFTLQLFLKQACLEPYHGLRARFLVIVYWIAATYVLADVYSAQLTSQFARPAREPPIDNLFKLEDALKYRNYQLFVEKDSSSLEMLANSTEIFRRLYKLMRNQNPEKGEEGYLVDSIETGVQLIADGSEKVILGGRETLYYNIKRHGLRNFQLSYKLYTRYSAVAVQIGCPFLDSLNWVLMRLFEGGILDKITNSEFEKMSQIFGQNEENNNERIENDKIDNMQNSKVSDSDIKPINLRMLQGAFIILFLGYMLAGFIFLNELLWKYEIFQSFRNLFKYVKQVYNKISIYSKNLLTRN